MSLWAESGIKPYVQAASVEIRNIIGVLDRILYFGFIVDGLVVIYLTILILRLPIDSQQYLTKLVY